MTTPILPRQTQSGNVWLDLLANPFQSQIQSVSFYAALGWSFGLSIVLFTGFIFLRPRTSNIYAPRAKHADARHKPPPIGKGLFSWVAPVKAAREPDLADKIGLDATIFLRFIRMLRNIFLCLSIIGCGVLIPVTLSHFSYDAPTSGYGSKKLIKRQSSGYGYSGYEGSSGGTSTVYTFVRMTPQYLYGSILWTYVVIAYIFTLLVYFFLWWNYRAVTRLRRTYFASSEYRNSLHSRTLVVTQIPRGARTEEGLIQLIQTRKVTEEAPKVAIARVVNDLPELIEQHEKAVLALEKYLATYLADPNKLPAKRPTCKPAKDDKQNRNSGPVDAIDYYTARIAYLENQISSIRQSVDTRNPLPYGFASYTHIEDAHAVAYATRKRAPQGTTIKLAPRPHDLIWKNLPMGNKERRTQSAWNGFWMVLLTILYIPPNAFVACFLTDLSNLGKVWKSFLPYYYAHPIGWSIVQGIIAPGIQLLFYLFLPTIFRRLLVRSGDTSKTSRERHVTSKLYAFFVFNNLFVFSVFSSVWAFVTVIIYSSENHENVYDAIVNSELARKLAISVCHISPYWVTYQLQRNLGAAVDILQAWPLIKNTFLKRFTNPTPRQLVEITAPQPFEYADYYNNYLFVATVGLVMGPLQPLMLPVTALYLAIDVWLKTYLLQYIFITKVESAGAFWRMTFNRILFAVFFMDVVIALIVGALGGYDSHAMLYAMIPFLILLPAFKWYCAKSFDTEYGYVTTKTYTESELGVASGRASPGAEKKLKRAQDRVAVRYGHPALYKKLMTPMVHAKSQNLLRQIYRGRLESDQETDKYDQRPQSAFGYSDIYMGEMDSGRIGKIPVAGDRNLPFEVVTESELDFENFKKRQDFRSEFGGDGELYGRPEDQFSSRPVTPSSTMSFGAASTLMGGRNDSPTGYTPGMRSRSGSEIPVLGDGIRRQSYSRLPQENEPLDETTYRRGYAMVGSTERAPSPGPGQYYGSSSPYGSGSPRNYSPVRPVRQPTLASVDIPSPGLEGAAVSAAGSNAYHTHRPESMGSMGGMLQNAASMGGQYHPSATTTQQPQSPRQHTGPQRKPVGSGARHGYGASGGSASETGSGYGSPVGPRTPYDDMSTDYDYFRRGRMG